MTFSLYDMDKSETRFDDNATYSFNDAALLVVQTVAGRQVTYSPHAWSHIVEDTPKRPESWVMRD